MRLIKGSPACGGNVRGLPRTPIRGTKGARWQAYIPSLKSTFAQPLSLPFLRSKRGTRRAQRGAGGLYRRNKEARPASKPRLKLPNLNPRQLLDVSKNA